MSWDALEWLALSEVGLLQRGRLCPHALFTSTAQHHPGHPKARHAASRLQSHFEAV
jgi:hypothetical protein